MAFDYRTPTWVTASGQTTTDLNQALKDAAGNPLYPTRIGLKSEQQIYVELTQIGYTGPQDIASKLAAYDDYLTGVRQPPTPVTSNSHDHNAGNPTATDQGGQPNTTPAAPPTGITSGGLAGGLTGLSQQTGLSTPALLGIGAVGLILILGRH